MEEAKEEKKLAGKKRAADCDAEEGAEGEAKEAKPAKSKKPTYTDSEGNDIKKNVSSYFHFSAEKRAEVTSATGLIHGKAVNSKLGEMWRELSKEDRAKYEELAAKDKVRVTP